MAECKQTWAKKRHKGLFKKGFDPHIIQFIRKSTENDCAAIEDQLGEEEEEKQRTKEEKQRTNLVKFEENGSMFTRVQKSCSGSKCTISMGVTKTASSSSPPPRSSSSSSSPSSVEFSSFDEDMSADDAEAGPSTEQEARAASFQRPFEKDMNLEPPRWSRLNQQSKVRPKKRKEEKGQKEEGGNFFPEDNDTRRKTTFKLA